MSDALYSVVRCIPDPARGELFNIGIVAWADSDFRVMIDQSAARRAVKGNPKYARDALRSVQQNLEARLGRLRPFREKVYDFIQNQPGIPVALSEPLYVRLSDSDLDPLNAVLSELINRLVALPEALEESSPIAAEDPFDARLSSFIESGRIQKDYAIVGGRSGFPRTVDYFVNSRENIGLDRVGFRKGADETLLGRADAEAFKVVDILNTKRLRSYLVYCEMKEGRTKVNEGIIHIIKSAGGDVFTDPEQAAHAMGQAAQRV